MPSVVIEVTRYDDETGVVSVLAEQKVFTENFDGTAVLYSVSSVPVNPISGSTTCFVCPHCELRETVHLPPRGLYGHWGPAGPHDIRLACKSRTWYGRCEGPANPEQRSRWAEDGVFEPGLVHVTTTRGTSWTVLTPAQSAAWNARANAQSDSDSD
ncbi:MAG: putative movement protein P1 [Sobemovirus sp.]|nr:MAG: putative movement protein P1 [Sobemovirus sp.]